MVKFSKLDVPEALGLSKICQVSDEEVWRELVSPITQGLLGRIVRIDPPRLMETVAGRFPGDEVTNLNNHRLFGGQEGFVRFPYLSSFYKTANGALVIKRDLIKVEAIGWFGDVERHRGELIFKAALRDRRFDGTKRANDCSLLDFPYDDPVLNAPLHGKLKSCELSVYGFMPGSRVSEADGDVELEKFISQPYTFLDQPEKFVALFKRAWKGKRAPGQPGAPIKDVSELILPGFERLAKAKGYDLLQAAPSHYHVAKWVIDNGYLFSDAKQKETFAQFHEGLEQIRAKGTPLTRQQQSWVCVLQSLKPSDLIPAELNLMGPIWPQDNISQRCLWLYKPISEAGKALRLT
ncbi:MAG TPA: hypothetical protein V6D17_00755 [Candidatus Obscuribacterales bacterium]